MPTPILYYASTYIARGDLKVISLFVVTIENTLILWRREPAVDMAREQISLNPKAKELRDW